jgi:DNA polymerase-1
VADRKVMLIDGNSLTYRAFFALPDTLATASGQVTNAVFGFTSMLINLYRDHHPTGIAVAFDRPEPTFRHAQVADYKAGRSAAPDVLRQQMGLVREVVEALRIPILELPGFEADDILATLATQARDAGVRCVVVTGDRDAYQLVEDPYVTVLYNRRGVSDYVEYDEAGIAEKTGVPPALYTQYAALRGDTSDNLPGVPGVGEKTAAKLIMTYGGIDGIFEHVDEQTPKLRESLAAHEDKVRSNAEVMILVRDLDLDVGIDDLERGDLDRDEVRKLFEFLEFNTLWERLEEALAGDLKTSAAAHGALEAEITELDDPAAAATVLRDMQRGEGLLAVAGAWEGQEGRSPLEGIALVRDGDSGDVVWLSNSVLADARVAEALTELATPGARPIAAHDAKALMRSLLTLDIDLRCLALDTAIASYLLDPASSGYRLDELVRTYSGWSMPIDTDEPAAGTLDLDGTAHDASLTTARRALAVDRLIDPLLAEIDKQGLRRLNDDIEVPLIRVLAKMEEVGVAVDVDELRGLRDRLNADCERYRAAIYEDAGTEFNVNSTPQLREILFDKLGLTPQKKTKTGYSTDAASLEKLAGQHPIIDNLLLYREVEKLRSTYGDGLLAEVGSDSRIHATFNQTVARTGRLSSDQPNLHNIPVRSDLGREFRKAFVPAAGYELLVADYNQIELRCIAHLAEDPGLIASFESKRDIHTETASRIFSVASDKVTLEQRSKAKMVSYGLAYGMEAYGLGQRLNIPTDEAAMILDAYFEAFPAVKAYMERTVNEARKRGYTETLFGRRRQIPELLSSNYRIRQAGERQAMNAGIQGLAADIFKVALVAIDRALEAEQPRSRLILQVHDEVLLEVPPDEHDAATELIVTTMGAAADLRVPLDVNLSFGRSWADTKS